MEQLSIGAPIPPSHHHDAARRLRVLWIDDEIAPLTWMPALVGYGIDLEVVATGDEGLRRAAGNPYDTILVDLRLPDLYGTTIVRRLGGRRCPAPIVVVTGWYFEPEAQEEALRSGALSVHRKPVDDRALAAIVRRAVSGAGSVPHHRPDPLLGLIAVSASMRDIAEQIERGARSALPILVTGETGTGKELVAKAIHRASHRAERSFVPVNCGALPEALVESELFGHRKGAFTGAGEQTDGLVGAAHRGTLFLDEIGELPMSGQTRLLRCLDEGRVRRVGDIRERSVDVRVVAATNRSLEQSAAAGSFRQDLLFRLSGFHIAIPPLRERPDDIDALARYWAGTLMPEQRGVTIDEAAMAMLKAHPWPGNARELRHVIEHALLSTFNGVITTRQLELALPAAARLPNDIPRATSYARAQAALEANRGNRTKAAKALGVSRTTFWRWRKSGLTPDEP